MFRVIVGFHLLVRFLPALDCAFRLSGLDALSLLPCRFWLARLAYVPRRYEGLNRRGEKHLPEFTSTAVIILPGCRLGFMGLVRCSISCAQVTGVGW